jgi:hypothetical protein
MLTLAIGFVGVAAVEAVLGYGRSGQPPFDPGVETIRGPSFTTHVLEPTTVVLFIAAEPGDHIHCGTGSDAVEVVVPPPPEAVTSGGLTVEWDDGSLDITCFLN